MSNYTGNSSNIIRAEVWTDELKERVQDDLVGYEALVEWIDFPDGTTYTQPTIGGATLQTISEGVPMTKTAFDKGEWNMTVTEYVGSGTGISRKLSLDSRWNLESRIVPEQHRAIMEDVETKLFKAFGPNAVGGGGQTANSTNAINGLAHRFVGSGTDETLAPKDLSRITTAFAKAKVGLNGLIGFVDPSVAYALETSTNIQNISSNPKWEGIIETGILNATGLRFVRQVNGWDLWCSNYLDDCNETIGGLTTTAGKQNVFFAANPMVGVKPIKGVWRQMPKVDHKFEPSLQEDEYYTSAYYGLKNYRLESIACILTDTDQVS